MNDVILASAAGDLPEVHARFSIQSLGLDLPAITSILGLKPTHLRRAGSRSTDPLMPRADRWILDTKPQRTVDGTAAVLELVGALDGVHEKLGEVRSKYPEATVDIVLIAYVAPRPHYVLPDVTLSADLVARLARLGLQFTIDFTLLEE